MGNIFVSGYLKRVADTGSVLCPRIDLPERVPSNYQYPKAGNYFQSAKDYLFAVIEVISGMVPAVEFQKDSYSARGKEGESLLERLIEYAQRRNLYAILDINSGNLGKRENIEEAFGRYGVDACTFVSTPNFSHWKEWLEKGHMPIFIGPRVISNQNSESMDLEICQYKARMVLNWNTEVTRKYRFAGIGCVVGAKEAVRCREIAGDEVFFLIPGCGAQGSGANEAIGGLINSRQQPMGAVSNSNITFSWWDESKKKPREGKTLDLIKAAVRSANADLNAAIERKLGKSAPSK